MATNVTELPTAPVAESAPVETTPITPVAPAPVAEQPQVPEPETPAEEAPVETVKAEETPTKTADADWQTRLTAAEQKIATYQGIEQIRQQERKQQAVQTRVTSFITNLRNQLAQPYAQAMAMEDGTEKEAVLARMNDHVIAQAEKFQIFEERNAFKAEKEEFETRRSADTRAQFVRFHSTQFGVPESKIVQLDPKGVNPELAAKSYKLGMDDATRKLSRETRITNGIDNMPVPGSAGGGSYANMEALETAFVNGRINLQQKKDLQARLNLKYLDGSTPTY